MTMRPASDQLPFARALLAALVAALVSTGLLAAGATARVDGPPPTKKKGVLTVAVELGAPGFAEGKLSNPQGFSTDVGRAVAKRLGVKIRFIDYPFTHLFVPGPKPYDLALEFATITPLRARLVDFSTPEIASSLGVLVAKDITGPVNRARLRKLQVCGKEVTTGLAYVQNVLRPSGLVFQYPTTAAAFSALSAGICDAFVFDLPALIAAKHAAPGRYGAIVGRVGAPEYYGGLLPKGSRLLPYVNKAIKALKRDGTMKKIATRHFGAALFSTPVLR
jgi:polar amino acid transport system substrate-binding protein